MTRFLVCLGLSMALAVAACKKEDQTPPKTDGTTPQKTDDMVADAKAKLEQVKTLISEKKFDQADEVLKKVEAYKDKLPADMQKMVDQSRSMLDTSRKGLGSLPGVPTMPK